jgi:hypothetical protein
VVSESDTDTATLTRIADALEVDIAELFLTSRQSLILLAYRENRVEQLKNAVMKELSEMVTRLVRRELERTGELNLGDDAPTRPAKSSPKGSKPRR